MYPVAGSLMALSIIVPVLIGLLLPASLMWVRAVLLIASPLFMLYFALAAEHAASASRPYRGFRSAFRLLLVAALVIFILMRAGTPPRADRTINIPGGGAMVALLAGILFIAWLFPRFDRVFFPVRDDYAIAQEKKYAGLSEAQVFRVKNRKFHGVLKFTAAWLIGSFAVMSVLRHVPVVLTAGSVFAILYLLRKKLFFNREAVMQAVRGKQGEGRSEQGGQGGDWQKPQSEGRPAANGEQWAQGEKR
jgi:hypothetical protein